MDALLPVRDLFYHDLIRYSSINPHQAVLFLRPDAGLFFDRDPVAKWLRQGTGKS